MTNAESSFAASLADLGVTVTRTDTADVRNRIADIVTEPAVGVALDETFDDPAYSLADTPVTVDPTPAALRAATTGVTGAQLGVGDYGSLSLSMTDRASELVSLFVEEHVAVLRAADVVGDMETAIESLAEDIERTRGSTIVATGPSATADMGALVKGAHGPEDVHVVLVEEGA
ncbi:LUD domain-containing protein [Haloarcula litorea]|uniref:LUD domain-containing protein n=1 Tax=Haloarcula litorea TaxID=3032579 RepID=UPI0023E8B96D|nr:LUD domain-containing protein [Halomicroarcula sp. GDY20]